jgi:hypothetical protein
VPDPIDIEALAREERKRIDWGRVHVEADKRKPLKRPINVGRWITITARRKDNAD